MKILLCSLNYNPELTGIGKYTGDFAAWLAANGHEIRVVTAPPYYPEWRVSSGYSAFMYRFEILSGAYVCRCPLWVPVKPSGLKRLIHLATFAVSSLPVMLRQAIWRPDVVWVVAPAFFSAPGAWLTARLCGAPVWLHVQDYEVDAAFDLGLLKGPWLKRLVLGMERWMFRRFDVVSTISTRMKDRALAKGVEPARAVLFPNWVDISAIHPEHSGGDLPCRTGNSRRATGCTVFRQHGRQAGSGYIGRYSSFAG
jgi:colanic acid biosynthesis glycosyl transferase WcaI